MLSTTRGKQIPGFQREVGGAGQDARAGRLNSKQDSYVRPPLIRAAAPARLPVSTGFAREGQGEASPSSQTVRISHFPERGIYSALAGRFSDLATNTAGLPASNVIQILHVNLLPIPLNGRIGCR
jgi:hypothetical protein